MGVLDFISGIFKPLSDTVDELHTSDEERGKLKNALTSLQNTVILKQMELQSKLSEMAAKVATAEATSDNLFTKTYRPGLLCGMFVLICLDSFGYTNKPVPDVFYQAFGMAFGVVGSLRSVEKVFKTKSSNNARNIGEK